MTRSRGPAVILVACCFAVAALVLIDPDLGVWGARLVAPATLALVHLGAVLAGRSWAVVGVVFVSVAGLGAALVAGQLAPALLVSGKWGELTAPLVAGAYALVAGVHLLVRVLAERRAEREARLSPDDAR